MSKILLSILILFTIQNNAHEFNPAHLVIEESNSANYKYEATWLYPLKNIGKRAELIFPDICKIDALSPYPQGKYLVEKLTLNCTTTLKDQTIKVEYLSVLTLSLIHI